MELNEEQKKAAFCTENAVVAAGAGSGKTMVLANRFAWLLTEKGLSIDEILTLTFTKKAAAQMFKRIHSHVSQIAEKETGPKAERACAALENFIHARIQTLDSYSASLVRQCAPRYGISPDFKIDQERCQRLAIEISYPFLVEHRHHPAILKLYSGNNPNYIAGDIFANILFNFCDINKPAEFLTDIKKQFNIICFEWEKLCSKIKKLLKETEEIIFDDNSLLPELAALIEKNKKENAVFSKSKENAVFPESAEIRKYFDFLLDCPVYSCVEKAESPPMKKTITLLLYYLSSLKNINLQRGKKTGNTVKENIKQIRVLFDQFYSLSVSCMQAGFNISILSLLQKLQNIYLQKKRAEGILTFRDVANLSRTILIEQLDIRQSEKESFKAIMIDEFQDNNELQKDILFLLAEKPEIKNNGVPPAQDLSAGKLFFVGDEKQSIYLFRGADVSVFRRLKDELKSLDLPLKINYRSSPQLIGAFNALFGGTNFDPLGKETLASVSSVFAASQHLPSYEASYSQLQAGKEIDGKLSICILNKNTDNEENTEENSFMYADENEACFVAGKIRSLLDEKKFKANEIAILLRTRGPQSYFEKHLRSLDIPYTCEDINDLFQGGPVNDIMSVLRLAAHPHDSASYAEMLRSPFAGLSLGGAAVCLSFYSDNAHNVPFDDKPLEHLGDEDRKNYLYGQKIYSAICKKSESESICSLISELWHREGYRYETEWNSETSVYRELFDYLFHLAANADAENKGLASFTDYMRSFRDSGGELSEIEIPLERPNAVHLMTIHKSKGLEFPAVFLCGCGKRSRDDTCDIVYHSNETGVAFSAPVPESLLRVSNKRNNFFWQNASEEANYRRTAELRRLLYVGMTRAERELYITGSLELINENKNRDEKENLIALLKNYVNVKLKYRNNNIEGDTILDNDTFFGLLIPSILPHLDSNFFDLEKIPVYEENYKKEKKWKNSKLANDQKGLNEFIKKAEPFYKKAEVIKTPVIKDNHKSPVSLRREEDGFSDKTNFYNEEFSGDKADDIFYKVDSMLDKFSPRDNEYTEKFHSGSFGSIAHICVQAHLDKKEPVIPSNISSFLTPPEFDAFFEAGKELAYRFADSPFGKIAQNASLRECEFPFRSIMKNKKGEEVFINGTIDLFFDDENSIHIVDFKTDNRETPTEYTAQMACYYQAVSTLFAIPQKKECRAWLYYLRTGHAVEMTERIERFNLEKRAFS